MGGDHLWGLVLGFSQFNATEVTLLKQTHERAAILHVS